MKTTLIVVTSVAGLAALGGLALAQRREGRDPRPSAKAPGVGQTLGSPAQGRSKLTVDLAEEARERKAGRPANAAFIAALDLYNEGRFAESFASAERAIALAQPWQRGLLVEDARRQQGRDLVEVGEYRKALPYLEKDYRIGQSEALDLDLALCYLKLGDVEGGRRHYSDGLILRYNHELTARDLPGTGSAAALEASIRLARGLELLSSSRAALAQAELGRVESLAPRNAVAAYHRGMALVYMNRDDLAREHFARAAAFGRGSLRQDAAARTGGVPPKR